MKRPVDLLSHFIAIPIFILFASYYSKPACAASLVSGPFINPANGHSYFLLSQDNWINSENVAQAMGGHLVTINNQAENDWVFNTFSNSGGIDRSLWLGSNDQAAEGSFVWVSGEATPYSNWSSGQPNNGITANRGPESFAHMWSPDFSQAYGFPPGSWNDFVDLDSVDGISSLHGVVEIPAPIVGGPIINPANGHTYYLLSLDTWTNSEIHAIAMRGHLVTVDNQAENEWVYNTFSSFGGVGRSLWLGFTDRVMEGSFVWVSGEPVGFTNWSVGQPNNGVTATRGPESFAHMWSPDFCVANGFTPGSWNDYVELDAVDNVSPLHGVVELLPVNTPMGTAVSVQPLDLATGSPAPVTLNFPSVNGGGATTVASSSAGPPPPNGFKLGQPPTYYDISTTATFLGPVTLCFNYANASYHNEANLRLWHFSSSNSWQDITTSLNTSAKIICGQTNSFSPFVVLERDMPPQFEAPAPITANATSSSGASVNYTAPSATDDFDGTVAVNCSPQSGSTFGLGTTNVNCTTTDTAGNTVTKSFTVSVVYSWSGVLQPINTNGSSIFKLGSTVPVKFQLSGASAGIQNATARLFVAKLSNGVTGTEAEAVSTAAATSGNQFRWDSSNAQYIFNWGTKGLASGAGTYQVRIDLGDGVVRVVNVSLKQ